MWISPRRYANEVVGTTAAFHDVTDYRRLQDELEQANRQLETAYEEPQSTNEELETTNEELRRRWRSWRPSSPACGPGWSC